MRAKPCVLLCGFTGVGKTSIAQAFCGKGIVPDKAIGHGGATTEDFTYYSCDQLDIWDYRGFEPGEKIETYLDQLKKFAKKCYVSNGLEKCPHIVIYCIQGSGGRVTKVDLDVIEKIPLPTIVAITKDDITRPNQRKAIQDKLVNSGIPLNKIRYCSSEKKTGFGALLAQVLKYQPAAEKRLKELKSECFIATVVFQSNSCYPVVQLRRLRDEHLTCNAFGRWLIVQYYRFGPRLAVYIRTKPLLEWLARAMVLALVSIYKNAQDMKANLEVRRS